MKSIFRAFAALVVLAFAFCIGASAYLSAQYDNLAFTGEVLYGERSDAEGVSISADAILSRHLLMSAEYDLGTGTNVSDGSWSQSKREFDYYGYTPGMYIYGDSLYMNFSWGGSSGVEEIAERIGAAPWQEKVIEELASRMDSDTGSVNARLLLNDYVDRFPLYVYAGGVMLAGYEEDDDTAGIYNDLDASELFYIPLPGEVRLDASLSVRSEDGYSVDGELYIDPVGGDMYNSMASGVWASDGYLYFMLCIYRTDVTGRAELLDGSHLPGGGWGIWRVKCDGPEWAQEIKDGYLTVYLDTLESVYIFDDTWAGTFDPANGWGSARLSLSADGQRLLLFTGEGESIRLRVIDTASLSVIQDTALISPEEGAALDPDDPVGASADYLGVTAQSDCTVVRFDGRAAVLVENGGRYERVCLVNISDVPVTGTVQDERYLSTDERYFAWDGERLVMYEYGYYYDSVGRKMYNRVCIFEENELIYCEWLTTQFDDTRINSLSTRHGLSVEGR